MLLLLPLFSALPAAATPLVHNIRLSEDAGENRLVFDIDTIEKHSVFTLDNPERLVVDLHNVHGAPIRKQVSSLSSEFVGSVRLGRPEPDILRVVLDVNSAAEIKNVERLPASAEHPHERLVIDFAAGTPTAAAPMQESIPEPVKLTASPAPARQAAPTKGLLDRGRMLTAHAPGAMPPPASMQFKQRHQALTNTKLEKQAQAEADPAPSLPSEPPASLRKSPKQKKISMSKYPPEKVEETELAAPVPVEKPANVNYKPVVVIDAGHGGVDPGAIGKSGIHEKKLTLEYAKALKAKLENTGRYTVVLTRSNDQYVNLKARVKKAQRAKADLFISLHADSHPNPKTRGLSVYTISDSAATKQLASLSSNADREDVISGLNLRGQNPLLKNVLIDMVQRDTRNNSAAFAQLLVGKLGKDAKLLNNTHRFAGFVVLTGADVPSVLVELGYLSNPKEEELLRTKRYREQLVDGMYDAIDTYFSRQAALY